MIVLNSEKELIKVENWEDILDRPGYTDELDPNTHTLNEIIGRYAFRDKIRCGLTNCHTPHAKGYLVVTKDGSETNIGKDCGHTYFGVDFDTLSAKFDRDITEKENRDKLWSFTFRLEELRTQIDTLRKQAKGADWIYHNSKSLVGPGNHLPPEIVRRIASMAKSRQPILFTQREATAKEVESLEVMQGRKVSLPHYLDEPIAEIAGLDSLYPENNLRDLLVIELEEQIKTFDEEDIDSMSYERLRKWAKWIGTIDGTLERASKVIESGRRLLNSENLQPLETILRDKGDIALFRKYLKLLERET